MHKAIQQGEKCLLYVPLKRRYNLENNSHTRYHHTLQLILIQTLKTKLQITFAMTFTIASTYLAILLLCIVTLISAKNDNIPQFTSDNTLEESDNTVEENVDIFEDLVGDDQEVSGSAEQLVPIEVSKTRINETLTLTEQMKSHLYILSQQNSRNSTSW
jgi:hypothetical protein